MNTPNKLTILRILLVPIMVILSFFEIPGKVLWVPMTMFLMDIVFVIASITDKLDGYLARKNNQVTDLGKFLDPVADKLLINSMVVFLVAPSVFAPYHFIDHTNV